MSYVRIETMGNVLERTRLWLVVGAVLLGLTGAAQAGVVGSGGHVTIPIPTNRPGLSINLVTGETSTTLALLDGWDVRISERFLFSANTSRPAREAGLVSRVNRKVAGTYNLPLGFEVGPNLPYLSGQLPTDVSDRPDLDQQYNWSIPGDNNYVGVKFWNEATSAYHYGWMRFCVSGNLSIEPRALVEYAYESTPDTPIQVGAGGDASPSDCGSSGLTEIVAPYCIDSADISSTTIRNLVLEATASCNTLKFIQIEPGIPPDVDYLTNYGRDDQAPWENTTIQGPAGKPVNISLEGYNLNTQEKEAYSLKIRTLTLKDVNLDPSKFDFFFTGSPTDLTNAIALENASITWDATRKWFFSDPLSLSAGGSYNQLWGMNGYVPPPTTLTVGNGTTLEFYRCGRLERHVHDISRLYFLNNHNQADIDGGTLDIHESYLIWGEAGSSMHVQNGGKLMVRGSTSHLRIPGSLKVDTGGSLELGIAQVMVDVGELLLNDGSIDVGAYSQILTEGLVVEGSSTVNIGENASVHGRLAISVAAGETLTYAGTADALLETSLLDQKPGSLVRVTGECTLLINQGGTQVWDNGSIEIGQYSTLLIKDGANIVLGNPINVDGNIRVIGRLILKSQMAMTGNGTLYIDSWGSLVNSELTPVSIDPGIRSNYYADFHMRIDPTAGQSAKLIANTSIDLVNGTFLNLIVNNDKLLPAGTQFTIIEHPEGKWAGLFRRPGDIMNALSDGDEIIAGLNHYRINYNPTSITLTVVHPDRVQANDDYYTALQDQTLTVPALGVLDNDVNVTGTPLVVDPPMHGTVTLNPDGSFTYTPDPGFFGDDNFTYVVGSSNIATVYIHVRAQADCTLTAGYWQTHTGNSGAALDTTWFELPKGPATPFFLSGQTYLEVLAAEPNGNAYYILAQQYIAAELNFLRGADSSAVQSEFDAATALFEAYTPEDVAALESSDPVRQQFVDLAVALDDYNNGYVGPGHCLDE